MVLGHRSDIVTLNQVQQTFEKRDEVAIWVASVKGASYLAAVAAVAWQQRPVWGLAPPVVTHLAAAAAGT